MCLPAYAYAHDECLHHATYYRVVQESLTSKFIFVQRSEYKHFSSEMTKYILNIYMDNVFFHWSLNTYCTGMNEPMNELKICFLNLSQEAQRIVQCVQIPKGTNGISIYIRL